MAEKHSKIKSLIKRLSRLKSMSLPKSDDQSESNDQNQTPREIAKEITDGKKEPQHIGEHTTETITQEVVSLTNTNPAFRNKKWYKRAEHIRQLLNENIKVNPRLVQGLLNKLDASEKGGEL